LAKSFGCNLRCAPAQRGRIIQNEATKAFKREQTIPITQLLQSSNISLQTSTRERSRFHESHGETVIEDEGEYWLPLFPLGEVGYPPIRWQLHRIFADRGQAVRQIPLSGTGTEP
jgi:hypothetical protein